MTDIRQLRANRRHALQAWLEGNDGAARWKGDDARPLTLTDIQQMRLDVADAVGTPQDRAKWQAMADAEAARWVELDTAYEAAKAALPAE